MKPGALRLGLCCEVSNRLLRQICILWLLWHNGQSNLTIERPFTLHRCHYMLSKTYGPK